MRAAKIAVTIPEDHRLTIALPAELPAGPTEIIVLVGAAQADAPA